MTARRADASDAIVGLNIRTHRLARRMSQTALADKLGITFQQVQKYEKGTNRVGSGRLHQIAEILGVPVQVLFEGAASSGKGKSPVHLIAKRDAMRLVEAFA